ncbi:MAG: FAD-binding oxidoreductase [Deltaproteobacteria bacterium]|nr:FAD-binding oxidoreductase [Deltaproteobacteria bacterium]
MATAAPMPGARTLQLHETLRDNAGRAVPARCVYRTDDIAATARACLGRGEAVMMVGSLTSATANFELEIWRPHPAVAGHPVVGIQPMGLAVDASGDVLPTQAHLHGNPDEVVRSDRIRLHMHREGPDRHTIQAGAGVTLAQINRALREFFGNDEHSDYCVPVDLTTVDSAQLGAVYATGAQGPSRFRTSDLARRVTVYDGRQLLRLEEPAEVRAHEGLWGMTGAVVDLELRVLRRPKHRFGFFIPLVRSASGNWIDQVAAVLALLRDATTLTVRDGTLSSGWANGLIDGAEVVARETLELVAHTRLPAGPNRQVAQRVLGLMQARERSGGFRSQSDFGLYLTGNSRFPELDGFLDDAHSPLARLLEYADHSERFLHADGMTTVIDDERGLEDMRLLREAFADIARQHAKHRDPGQGKPFSESTDINCCIDPAAAAAMDVDQLREQFRWILQPYYAYEMRIRDLAEVARAHGATVTMSRYGHLNPRSTNLHTRVTVHAPEGSIAAPVLVQVVQRARDNLINVLKELSERHATVRVEGGEKGKMTPEAWHLMTPAQRDEAVRLLAAADPAWQPHLKGNWARAVQTARAG